MSTRNNPLTPTRGFASNSLSLHALGIGGVAAMSVVRVLLAPVLGGQEAMFLLLVPVLAVSLLGAPGPAVSSAATAIAIVALSPSPEHLATPWLYRGLFAA